jgi:AcrR family transcriptional regulator
MHCMSESATGLRERRIAATSARLTALAREWTAERGFAGFTVEELCEAVGVSRRTFFNYFSTKEDVVLGIPTRVDHAETEERFLAAAGPRGASGLSSTLLPDLAEMLITRWEALGLGEQDFDALIASIEHAPRLLGRALQMTRDQERDDIALVERRENLAPGDLRASTVVHLLGSILRGAVEETLSGTGEESLRTVFARRLAAARTVFAA